MRAELEDALTHFEHATALMPGDPEPLASLAAIARADLLEGLADDASLQALATLTPSQARTLREDYWRGVEGLVAVPLAGRTLVDKMPLHTVALPLLARLFPDAKVQFALRDPRDLVLSCLRRRFQVNVAMFEFLTLEGAARYYDAVMGPAGRYCGLNSEGVGQWRRYEPCLRPVLGLLATWVTRYGYPPAEGTAGPR